MNRLRWWPRLRPSDTAPVVARRSSTALPLLDTRLTRWPAATIRHTATRRCSLRPGASQHSRRRGALARISTGASSRWAPYRLCGVGFLIGQGPAPSIADYLVHGVGFVSGVIAVLALSYGPIVAVLRGGHCIGPTQPLPIRYRRPRCHHEVTAHVSFVRASALVRRVIGGGSSEEAAAKFRAFRSRRTPYGMLRSERRIVRSCAFNTFHIEPQPDRAACGSHRRDRRQRRQRRWRAGT